LVVRDRAGLEALPIACAANDGAAVDILRAELTEAPELDRRWPANDGKLVVNVRTRGEVGPSKNGLRAPC
jgi:hypothetical protein